MLSWTKFYAYWNVWHLHTEYIRRARNLKSVKRVGRRALVAETGTVLMIKRNPTVSFFFFAFLITWTAWFTAPALILFGPYLVAFVNQIGGFGPAFAAILVSSTVDSIPFNAPSVKRRITFAVVFAAAFFVQLLATYVVGGSIVYQTILFAFFGATLPAFVFSSIYHPNRGVAKLLSGLRGAAFKNAWVGVALLLPFVWQFLGAAVDFSLGGNELLSFTSIRLLGLIGYYPFIVFFGGGLNEEPGWRGLAVPQMQGKYSPLIAGLIIGVIWSTWHFPLHATGVVQGGMANFPFRFLYNVPLGILFSWFYNKSEGNLLGCVLLHASYNSASTLFGDNTALISMVLMMVFTAIAAIYERMWRKDFLHKPQAVSQTTFPVDRSKM